MSSKGSSKGRRGDEEQCCEIECCEIECCEESVNDKSTGQKNVNDTSEIDNNPKWPGFVGWWTIGAVVLAIPLALSGTVLRTVHIRNVRLLGFFFWLAISWCSLLFSYFTSWALGYLWFHLCQEDRLNFDDYQNFVVDIRHSIMLFLWAIISWASVPLFCVLDHRHCTDHWVSVLHEVLLVTFIFAIVFLIKSFFVERLFIKAAMEYGSWKQRELEKSFYAIVTLLPEPHPCQSICEWMKDIGTWMEDMRTWSTTPKRTRPFIYTLKDLEQTKFPPSSPEELAKYPKYVAEIFKGNGTENAYKGLLSAIGSNQDLQRKCSDGLCKTDIDQYLQGRDQGLLKCNKDYSLALKQFEDKDGGDTRSLDPKHKKGIDTLWSKLKHEKDEFKDSGIDTLLSKLKHKNVGVKDSGIDTMLSKLKHEESEIEGQIDTLWSKLKDKEGKLDDLIDILWSELNHKEGEITFKELYWQIQYLGESLREVVEGQKNLKRVVCSLHVRASLFLCIPVAVIYVAIFTKNFVTYFSPLWTAFFGISFAIQDPVKEFVSACIFVFAQHPYDVGDLVILEEEKDAKLVVTEISLMHTTFQPVGSGKEYHIPHTKLSKECIENICRPDSHISVMLPLKFDKITQKIKEGVEHIQKHLIIELETEVLKVMESRTEASKREASETAAFEDYQKHQTLRLYKMPVVTYVPVKEGDFVEGGVLVDFQVKYQTAWIPRTFYPNTHGFRDEVLHYVRCRLENIPGLNKSFGMENAKANSDKGSAGKPASQ